MSSLVSDQSQYCIISFVPFKEMTVCINYCTGIVCYNLLLWEKLGVLRGFSCLLSNDAFYTSLLHAVIKWCYVVMTTTVYLSSRAETEKKDQFIKHANSFIHIVIVRDLVVPVIHVGIYPFCNMYHRNVLTPDKLMTSEKIENFVY